MCTSQAGLGEQGLRSRRAGGSTACSCLLDFLSLTDAQLADADIALMNLLCAEGLPGAENLNVRTCLARLDDWTDRVRRYTRDCAEFYQRYPERYGHHKGFFKLVSMAILLKRGIGIRYQVSAIDNLNFADSRDDLLHGLLTRKLGTCASMPVLCVAIGRRLGYPVFLAQSRGHYITQWLSPDGTHLNFEISGNEGECSRFDDEHYLNWPRPMSQRDRASGRFLRPLQPHEELACFLATRGHCMADNGRMEEARATYEQAHRIAPTFSALEAHLNSLDILKARDQFAPSLAHLAARFTALAQLRDERHALQSH